MPDQLLTINAGSSSLKFATFKLAAEPRVEIRGQLSGIGQGDCKLSVADADGRKLNWQSGKLASHADALKLLIERLGVDDTWTGVGHRVVHGGTRFTAPIRIDAESLSALKALYPLAPLHQPHNVAAIEAVAAMLPRLPQIACFDTAFHADQPEVAARFALPERYWRQGIRRYGFHGLSYEAILHRLPGVIGTIPSRLVIAHLGNGASLAAVKDGICVATTMGFSTLDGLVMGTRAGLLDPGVILHLMRHEGLDLIALEKLLYHESGLKALSGATADMKALLASSDARAELAVEIYCYRISRELGSLAAALGGLDALVFTGGIGENAAAIRAKVCAAASWLGLGFDPVANTSANATAGPRISAADSTVSAWVIPTDEELTIARHCGRLLSVADA